MTNSILVFLTNKTTSYFKKGKQMPINVWRLHKMI